MASKRKRWLSPDVVHAAVQQQETKVLSPVPQMNARAEAVEQVLQEFRAGAGDLNAVGFDGWEEADLRALVAILAGRWADAKVAHAGAVERLLAMRVSKGRDQPNERREARLQVGGRANQIHHAEEDVETVADLIAAGVVAREPEQGRCAPPPSAGHGQG